MDQRPSLEPSALLELAETGGQEAEEFFRNRTHMCADGVLEALNKRLGGGLDERTLRNLTAALPNGVGGAGCVCGALSGGLLAVGLMLGQDEATPRKDIRAAGRRLHAAFTKTAGAACCRTLTKKVKTDPKAHFDHCAGLTRLGAELAAGIILEMRPELAQADAATAPRASTLTRTRRMAGHAVGRMSRAVLAVSRKAVRLLSWLRHAPKQAA
jgi:C_GCAxxG_C_C family probable redox protein